MTGDDHKGHERRNSVSSVRVYRTRRFSVLSHPDDETFLFSSHHHSAPTKTRAVVDVYLDVDCPYTRRAILEAFAHSSREKRFRITLGPGRGLEANVLPKGCQFQWAEYERIDWAAVLDGKHGASSYFIRKGFSRKAQLSYYTKRYVTKNPESILSRSLPQTIVIDTWQAFEEGHSNSYSSNGLADVVVAASSERAWNVRERLLHCLASAKTFMAEENDETNPLWILKGSTTNKGSGIHLVHIFEEVVDICWSECAIREW